MTATKRRKFRVESAFVTVPELATILGVGRTTAWREAKERGHVAGIRPVQVTPSKMVFSRAAVERLMADADGDDE